MYSGIHRQTKLTAHEPKAIARQNRNTTEFANSYHELRTPPRMKIESDND